MNIQDALFHPNGVLIRKALIIPLFCQLCSPDSSVVLRMQPAELVAQLVAYNAVCREFESHPARAVCFFH